MSVLQLLNITYQQFLKYILTVRRKKKMLKNLKKENCDIIFKNFNFLFLYKLKHLLDYNDFTRPYDKEILNFLHPPSHPSSTYVLIPTLFISEGE